MKVGIIRCMQTEDLCPGTADFAAVRSRTGTFSGAEEAEVVGFVSCGGCPGKRAVARARELVRRGADTIALASCIHKGTPIGFPCPHREALTAAIRAAVGTDAAVLDHTH